MLHVTVFMLALAVISTGAAIWEESGIFKKRYTWWTTILWAASFALGCTIDWWQSLDCLPILAAVLLACALRTLDPDVRFFSLLGATVALEVWQLFRWTSDGWWLAAAILSAGVIPWAAYFDIAKLPKLWTERASSGELYGLPTPN